MTTHPHPTVTALERAAAEGKFTAWSMAAPTFACSAFHADEVHFPGSGLFDLTGPFHPRFDLASLTKPLFLNQALRRAFPPDRSEALWQPVVELFEPLDQAGEVLLAVLRQKGSTLRLIDFLDHTTRTRPWFWFGRGAWQFKADAAGRSAGLAHAVARVGESLRTLATHTLTQAACGYLADPAQPEVQYSDLNTFLLARLVEGLGLGTLAQLHEQNNDACGSDFSHASWAPERSAESVPYFPYVSFEDETQVETLGVRAFGPVHDTNANILSTLNDAQGGVVSGHAGYFGSVFDVVAALSDLRTSQRALCERLKKQSDALLIFSRRFVGGLDTPSSAQSPAGLSEWPLPRGEQVFGHLGYTGNSFWFAQTEERTNDDERWHVLLTNRVARRRCFGTGKVPRLLVTTPLTAGRPSGESEWFELSQGVAGLRPIEEDEALAAIDAARHGRTILWEHAALHAPSDIGDVRRALGRSLWPL